MLSRQRRSVLRFDLVDSRSDEGGGDGWVLPSEPFVEPGGVLAISVLAFEAGVMSSLFIFFFFCSPFEINTYLK